MFNGRRRKEGRRGGQGVEGVATRRGRKGKGHIGMWGVGCRVGVMKVGGHDHGVAWEGAAWRGAAAPGNSLREGRPIHPHAILPPSRRVSATYGREAHQRRHSVRAGRGSVPGRQEAPRGGLYGGVGQQDCVSRAPRDAAGDDSRGFLDAASPYAPLQADALLRGRRASGGEKG
ncbi:hypothetical protein E2C01_058748 [Portunus trituberculatus]|uniref:Uncharacterized protein n=1 Tax=Portunus trituberculatus TaxID=210409 RepID=A0A5B7GXA8_PORTR|nr:hypothetical protein [Portunus trituberculatus]